MHMELIGVFSEFDFTTRIAGESSNPQEKLDICGDCVSGDLSLCDMGGIRSDLVVTIHDPLSA